MQHIRYNPANDPQAYLAQALQQFGKTRRQRGDVRDIAKYAQYQRQLSGAEALQQSLMGLTPEQRQQYQGPTPQWPAHQPFPQLQSPELQQLAAKLQLQKSLAPERYGAGRLGTVPGWWAYATEKQKQDYMNRVGGPLVQVGQKLLTSKQRQALADKGFVEEMGLSNAESNKARQSVKTIVSEMSHGTWAGDMKGFKNFKRSNLIQGYKQYRTENDYASKSAENRKWLDKNWDNQMTTYNKAGYKEHGKNEFDWDPKDPKVKALRKENTEQKTQTKEKSPYAEYPDAFLEDGVWKVMRDGKKYRIEE